MGHKVPNCLKGKKHALTIAERAQYHWNQHKFRIILWEKQMMHINPKSRSIQFSSLHKIPNFYEGKHNKSYIWYGFHYTNTILHYKPKISQTHIKLHPQNKIKDETQTKLLRSRTYRRVGRIRRAKLAKVVRIIRGPITKHGPHQMTRRKKLSNAEQQQF